MKFINEYYDRVEAKDLKKGDEIQYGPGGTHIIDKIVYDENKSYPFLIYFSDNEFKDNDPNKEHSNIELGPRDRVYVLAKDLSGRAVSNVLRGIETDYERCGYTNVSVKLVEDSVDGKYILASFITPSGKKSMSILPPSILYRWEQ